MAARTGGHDLTCPVLRSHTESLPRLPFPPTMTSSTPTAKRGHLSAIDMLDPESPLFQAEGRVRALSSAASAGLLVLFVQTHSDRVHGAHRACFLSRKGARTRSTGTASACSNDLPVRTLPSVIIHACCRTIPVTNCVMAAHPRCHRIVCNATRICSPSAAV